MHISRQVAGTLIAGRSTAHLRRRMSRRLVYKLTRRVLPWAPTKVRSKKMRWRWTSINLPRRRGTRFSTREKWTPRKLRTKKAKEKEKKEGKKGEKSGKSKSSTPPLLLTKTSYASPSQNPCKRDASTAQLSLSRLQQIT
jgi:hypothetical protein